MKTKLIALIIIGVIISAGVGYLYDQMYDCLFPPMWMKIPRSYSLGDCLQMYADGTLPDWTKAREDHAEKQARNMELIEHYKDTPEVIAFYAKYDDANVSVGEDFVSYSAGNVDDFRVRMNLYFDENHELDYIDFFCYVGGEFKHEVPQEDILHYLQNYDYCEKKLVQGQVEPVPEPVRTPPPEPPFEKKEPLTKIEVMFGEKLNDGLVPVIVTEVTTHAETLDEIMVWNFELIGHSGDDRRVVWDTLPKDKRIWYEITDDNVQDAIDYTRMPENYAIPADQHIYEMDCGFFQIVEGESAHPSSFPIKNNTSSIFAKNSWMGLYPDSDGEYSFEFASIFEHYVRLPEDIGVIISHETKECDARWQIDGKSGMEHGNGYYTKMVFRLE